MTMVTIMTNSAGEQIAMVVDSQDNSPDGDFRRHHENDNNHVNGNVGQDCNNTSLLNTSDDDDDGCPSSPNSIYENGDLMTAAMGDEVTAQLAAAGPVGVAAAAAIVSTKKRKRPHSFETNPSIRKRQQNRLLRKLRATIDEFTIRVGQQAVVLVATPGKANTCYKVFGAKPLEDVVKNLRNVIMDELESALAQQTPAPIPDDPSLFELPPLVIDGIPTPVEKMTQAQLRAFIPLMLKYSTGRGKPGWGRESTRPPWWPNELPWANVRMDARNEDEKQKISWTHALRQIVINCYKFHGREDLFPVFNEEDERSNGQNNSTVLNMHHHSSSGNGQQHSVVVLQGSSGQDGHHQSNNNHSHHQTAKIQIQAGSGGTQQIIVTPAGSLSSQTAQVCLEQATYSTDVDMNAGPYPTVLQTISNPDGSISIVQVDPNNPIITLPDGTTAHVQGLASLPGGDGQLTEVTTAQGEVVELNSVTEATLNQEGQLILTTHEDGYPVSVSGVITVPVSPSMYQTMVANIQQIQTNSDGTVSVTPMVQMSKDNGLSDLDNDVKPFIVNMDVSEIQTKHEACN